MKLKDKVILITGGGRGIGYEIAKALAEEGARIAINGSNGTALRAASSRIGGDVFCIEADLFDPDAPEHISREIEKKFGALDILVNNAGIQLNYSFFDQSYHVVARDIDRELAINLSAPLKLSAAMLPLIRCSHEGAIVNVGSGLALAPKTSAAVYCASKAALRNFTRALRYQANQEDGELRIVDVMLPMVATNMTAGRGAGKIEPEVVAEALVNGLKGNRDEIYVGKTGIFSLIMRIAPALGYRLLRGGPTSKPTTSVT